MLTIDIVLFVPLLVDINFFLRLYMFVFTNVNFNVNSIYTKQNVLYMWQL